MVLKFNPFDGTFENILKQVKIRAFASSTLNNFTSNEPTNIPGLVLTIQKPGDYSFMCFLDLNHDSNEEAEMDISLTPIDDRPVSLADGSTVVIPAGTPFILYFQAVRDRFQNKQDQTFQGFYELDNLKSGDVINFLLDTRGDDTDITNRRCQGETFV